ncbi:MAG: SLC13 family permease, partial [Planctomycetaceae bacterium]|nr:SLC13 family permease [Planctomycetaceae bacterium]
MQIALTLGVIAAAVFALVVLRAGPDLVLLGGLTILLVAGIVSPGEALAGFGNEGLVTVAVLFVIAEGLHQTGSITFIGQRLLGQPKSLNAAQRRIVLPSAIASAFLNNTPVVAMLLPVITDWSRKQRLPVSQLLLPLSYATILGGLCTLVGTSTTLVVNGLLIEERGYGLRMFEIAWVGLPATLIGLAWLLLFTRKLLPDRLPVASSFDDPREYTAEMIVDPASPLVGRTIEEAGLRHLPGVYLAEIERGGQILPAVASTERLQGKDRLVFVGVVESVVDLRKLPGLNPATDQVFKLTGAHTNRVLVEAVVSNSCPYIRTTIREARFRANYNAAVVAVARNGQRIRQKIGDIELIPGDTLLLEAHPSFVQLQRNSRDFFLVSTVEGSTALRHEKAWIARLLLAGMVIAVATGLLSMLKAALLTAGAMIATRCLSGSEARQSIDW